VTIHDSLKVRVSAPDAAARGVRYVWFVDSPLGVDTASDSILTKVFTVTDTGKHLIVIKAVDRSGIESQTDTVVVNVRYRRPRITLGADTIPVINAPFALAIHNVGAENAVVRYQWYIDNPLTGKATIDTVLQWVWTIADTGKHCIVVRAVDGDGIWSYPCSLRVTVNFQSPGVKLDGDTVAFVGDSYALRISGTEGNSRIERFVWYIDDSLLSKATIDTLLTWVWSIKDTGRHVIAARAVDRDGVASPWASLVVRVAYFRPVVRLFADTTVAINDTILLAAQANDSDGVIDHYLWSIDGAGTVPIVTTSDTLLWVFSGNTEGYHTIRVAAVDDDGLVSMPDSIRIHMLLRRPWVRLNTQDTMIYASRGLLLHAAAFDTNGTIAEYRWMLDGRLLPQSLRADTVTLRWSPSQAGAHLVSITVVDDDSLVSASDSILVTVLPGTPLIAPMHDTAISSSDTLKITSHASDSNGTIARYLWSFSGAGWADSTTDSSHTIVYSGKGTEDVIVGVRDNDGLVAADTFTVTFNRPPDTIMVSAPTPNDSIMLPEKTESDTLAFIYSAHDSDNDSITYSLFWGTSTDSLLLVYNGGDRSAKIYGVLPGRYFWRIAARDSWGHARVTNGSVAVIREYTICFIGHSIVAGYGGDSLVGGFRGGVLDSIRTMLGSYERLKTVGIGTTSFMKRSVADDSCLAILGARAVDLNRFISAVAIPSADIWVLMIGVNDQYNTEELVNTICLMDVIISRNPKSRVYVLNGNQIAQSYWNASYWLPSFNQVITDAIAARAASGFHIFEVDGYTALSDSIGQYDSSLFNSDGVHPNQAGYDRLRDAICLTMKNSDPLVIPKNP
jgi:lysophospholipase L1-like esterase